jgi:hypothetical protein
MVYYEEPGCEFVCVGFNPDAHGLYLPLGSAAMQVVESFTEPAQEDELRIERARKHFDLICRNRLADVVAGEYDITRLLETGANDTDQTTAGKVKVADEFIRRHPELRAGPRYNVTPGVFMVPWGTIENDKAEEAVEVYYKYTNLAKTGSQLAELRESLQGSPFIYESHTIVSGERVPALRLLWHTIFAVKKSIPSSYLLPNPNENEPIDPAINSSIGHIRGEFNFVDMDEKDDDVWPEDDFDTDGSTQ